ncbi:MAG: hypothetical protein U5L08_00840 [Xanthomonadales bacterium]|nr:hypothetical protein [Xanthomonadales bacterium]
MAKHFLVFFVVPSLLFAQSPEPACIRLSFDDSGSHFYDYVVLRDEFLEMIEASGSPSEKGPLTKSEAVSLAAEADSQSPNDIRIVHRFERAGPEGTIWLYRIGFNGRKGHEDIVVAPNGTIVRPRRVEGRMMARPDCSNYSFNADAGKASR